MKRLLWISALLLLAQGAASAVSKEIVQLQREVAMLDDRVRTLQRSVAENARAMTILVRQTLDRVKEVRESSADFDNTLRERLQQQQPSIGVPAASLAAKLDQITSQFTATKEAIEDVRAQLERLEQKIIDVETAVRIIQTPRPPPPSGPIYGNESNQP